MCYDLPRLSDWCFFFFYCFLLFFFFFKQKTAYEMRISDWSSDVCSSDLYLMLAARAMGLDCGPMSGFDNGKVDAAFFAGTAIRSNFLINLGYGDPAALYPRSPRLSFAEACQIV